MHAATSRAEGGRRSSETPRLHQGTTLTRHHCECSPRSGLPAAPSLSMAGSPRVAVAVSFSKRPISSALSDGAVMLKWVQHTTNSFAFGLFGLVLEPERYIVASPKLGNVVRSSGAEINILGGLIVAEINSLINCAYIQVSSLSERSNSKMIRRKSPCYSFRAANQSPTQVARLLLTHHF